MFSCYFTMLKKCCGLQIPRDSYWTEEWGNTAFLGRSIFFFQNKWRFYRHVVIKFEICIWWSRWAIDRIDNHKCKVSCVLVFMCDTLCNLLPFVQIKKCEKHLWVRVTLSKSSTPLWLLVTFFNCINGTKLRKAFLVIH